VRRLRSGAWALAGVLRAGAGWLVPLAGFDCQNVGVRSGSPVGLRRNTSKGFSEMPRETGRSRAGVM
jgi:hypothetical protein